MEENKKPKTEDKPNPLPAALGTPAATATQPAVCQYRYIGPAAAERVVIPGTVVAITLAHLNDATIAGLLKQHPGMARLYEPIA